MSGAVALLALMLAGAAPSRPECRRVEFEYVNATKEPVHVMAFYRMTHGGKTTTKALREGMPISPGLTVRIVSECIPKGAKVEHSAEVIGIPAESVRRFTASATPTLCRFTVGAKGVKHECGGAP